MKANVVMRQYANVIMRVFAYRCVASVHIVTTDFNPLQMGTAKYKLMAVIKQDENRNRNLKLNKEQVVQVSDTTEAEEKTNACQKKFQD